MVLASYRAASSGVISLRYGARVLYGSGSSSSSQSSAAVL